VENAVETLSFEAQVESFWDQCDSWVQHRCAEVAGQAAALSEEALEKIRTSIEEDMNGLIEQGIDAQGEAFSPMILLDLHHLFFELALKEYGVDNQEQIHHYKDNGQVGISVIEGALTPDNAALVIQLNRAHHEKKGGAEDGACEDCICGKK
jgi:hypothetical protein